MKRILFSCCVLSITFFYSFGFCTFPEESPTTDSSSGNSLFTKFEDDLLSVDIKDVPLGEILQKLSDETGILFSFPPPIGEERVMVRFSNFTIPEALNKILSSHDRIFIYEERQSDSDESLPSKLKEVRLFTPLPKGTSKGATSEPTTVTSSKSNQPTKTAKATNVQRKTGKRPPAKKQTVASLGEDLKNNDYRVRLDTVRNLRNIGNADAIGHLTTALEDKNPQVSEAAKNALQELQDEKTDLGGESNTDDDGEPTPAEVGSAPVIVGSFLGDSENPAIDVRLSGVEEPLITAGLWIEYDASQMNLVSADINSGDGAWDTGMSQTVKDPKGPGTYMITAGNLSTVNPDDSNEISVANLQYQCLSGNCSGQQVIVRTVPGFDSVVGNSSGVYDSKIKSVTITIP
jgi:hypothetical protein